MCHMSEYLTVIDKNVSYLLDEIDVILVAVVIIMTKINLIS